MRTPGYTMILGLSQGIHGEFPGILTILRPSSWSRIGPSWNPFVAILSHLSPETKNSDEQSHFSRHIQMPTEAGSLRAEARRSNSASKCRGSSRKHFAFCFWILSSSICITITQCGIDLEVNWKRPGKSYILVGFVVLACLGNSTAWDVGASEIPRKLHGSCVEAKRKLRGSKAEAKQKQS